MGDTVNTTARLASAAGAGEILVTEDGRGQRRPSVALDGRAADAVAERQERAGRRSGLESVDFRVLT